MAVELLSPLQAAEIAGCHSDTIRRAAHFGLLKAQRVGYMWVIKSADLQNWINAGMPNHRRKSTRKTRQHVFSEETTGELNN